MNRIERESHSLINSVRSENAVGKLTVDATRLFLISFGGGVLVAAPELLNSIAIPDKGQRQNSWD